MAKYEETGSPLVRFNSDGTQDTTFQLDTDLDGNVVYKISLQPNGKFIVWGNSPVRVFERLNPDGSRDETFIVPEEWELMHVVGTGLNEKIYIAGSFVSINDELDNGLARLNANGSRDFSFYSGARALAGADSTIDNVITAQDNKLLISGKFRSYNGSKRKGLARLNEDGTLDITFAPDPSLDGNYTVQCVYPNGKVLVVDDGKLKRLNSDGSLDTAFNALNFSYSTYDVTIKASILPGGKILVGGRFTHYGTVPCFHLCKLNDDGSLDTTFTSQIALVQSTNVDVKYDVDYQNERIVVGLIEGDNYSVQKYDFNGIIDPAFNPLPNSSMFWVDCIAVENDGNILVYGYKFGTPYYHQVFLRLNANGSVNQVFRDQLLQGSLWMINLIKPVANGKFYIAADSSFFTGQSNVRLARFNTDGLIDDSFEFSHTEIKSVAFQGNDGVMVTGSFDKYNSIAEKFIARLNTTAVLGVAIPQREASTIGVYRDNEMLNLSAPSGSAIRDIAIFDMAGRLVFKKANLASRQESVQLGKNKSVLVLKVTLTDGAVVEKKVY